MVAHAFCGEIYAQLRRTINVMHCCCCFVMESTTPQLCPLWKQLAVFSFFVCVSVCMCVCNAVLHANCTCVRLWKNKFAWTATWNRYHHIWQRIFRHSRACYEIIRLCINATNATHTVVWNYDFTFGETWLHVCTFRCARLCLSYIVCGDSCLKFIWPYMETCFRHSRACFEMNN